MKRQTVVEWPEIIQYAESECGYFWNYAHDLLRIFQGYDHTVTVYCDEIENFNPIEDPYVGTIFKNEFSNPEHFNQQGRDIVYSFMQKYNIKEMLVVQS